jgi:hypothetical protein
VIKDELFPSSDRVSAEETFQKERVILNVVHRFRPCVDVEDDQSTVRKVVIVGKESTTGNNAVGIAHDVVEMGRADDCFHLAGGLGVVYKLNGVRHVLYLCFGRAGRALGRQFANHDARGVNRESRVVFSVQKLSSAYLGSTILCTRRVLITRKI